MVNESELIPGVKIKLVDLRTAMRGSRSECIASGMERFFDSVVTLGEKSWGDGWYKILEDEGIGMAAQGNRWYWHRCWFEYIEEDLSEVPEVDNGQLTNLLFG